MAGVKGRSGGARRGAGRKKKEIKPLPASKHQDPLEFLLGVQNNAKADPNLRIKAAVAAARILYSDEGKKAQARKRAGTASKGRFASAPPPKLVVSNG